MYYRYVSLNTEPSAHARCDIKHFVGTLGPRKSNGLTFLILSASMLCRGKMFGFVHLYSGQVWLLLECITRQMLAAYQRTRSWSALKAILQKAELPGIKGPALHVCPASPSQLRPKSCGWLCRRLCLPESSGTLALMIMSAQHTATMCMLSARMSLREKSWLSCLARRLASAEARGGPCICSLRSMDW